MVYLKIKHQNLKFKTTIILHIKKLELEVGTKILKDFLLMLWYGRTPTGKPRLTYNYKH